MDLNHKTFGHGHPLIILHGLFGMLDNWQTLGRRWSEEYMVFLIDQRNHGRSPHTEEMDYPAMAADVQAFLESKWVHKAHLLGHSMGGKTVMQVALHHPELVDKLVVVDIAPKVYQAGHNIIFEAMHDLQPETLADRQEAEQRLAEKIPERSVRQFLMKNLRRNRSGAYEWKMNLPVLDKHYHDILDQPEALDPFEGPTLFIRGDKSHYVQDEDIPDILELFPNAVVETIPNAGHWVHAEQPEALFQLVKDFLHE
jgi:esterase